jgi:hypothetical protein
MKHMPVRSIAIAAAALALGFAAISDAEARSRNGPAPPSAKAPGKVAGPSSLKSRPPAPRGVQAPRPSIGGSCPPSVCGRNGRSLDGLVLGGTAHLGSGTVQGVVLPSRDAGP